AISTGDADVCVADFQWLVAEGVGEADADGSAADRGEDDVTDRPGVTVVAHVLWAAAPGGHPLSRARPRRVLTLVGGRGAERRRNATDQQDRTGYRRPKMPP